MKRIMIILIAFFIASVSFAGDRPVRQHIEGDRITIFDFNTGTYTYGTRIGNRTTYLDTRTGSYYSITSETDSLKEFHKMQVDDINEFFDGLNDNAFSFDD